MSRIIIVLMAITTFGCVWANPYPIITEKEITDAHSKSSLQNTPIRIFNSATQPKQEDVVKLKGWQLVGYVEAKATKDADTDMAMLDKAIEKARTDLKADGIYCPSAIDQKVAAQPMALFPTSIDEAKKTIETIKEISGVVKDMLALPFTFVSDIRSALISEKTLSCNVYIHDATAFQ